MSTQYTLKEGQEDNTRKYPLFSTTRLKRSTLNRLKKYGSYGTSIDDCVTVVLDSLAAYENEKKRSIVQ